MSGFGAKAYGKLGLQTDVIAGDPHRQVLMLFDGALISIRRARAFLEQGRVAERCEAVGLALEIVDSGLRVSVDPTHDPAFAARLVRLYQFVAMRLLQANLRGDLAALDDAASILGGLREAWVRIRNAPRAPQAQDQARADAGAPGAQHQATPVPANRRALAAYQG